MFTIWSPTAISYTLTVDYAPNQEATSVLHGLVSDLLTKLSPSQRHLPGTHCQLTFVIVVALGQHSRIISRLSCFMELLICISIFYLKKNNTTCCVVRRCWTLAEWRLSKCRWYMIIWYMSGRCTAAVIIRRTYVCFCHNHVRIITRLQRIVITHFSSPLKYTVHCMQWMQCTVRHY